MKTLLLTALLCLISTQAYTQIYGRVDSTYWSNLLEISLAGSESAYSNWSAGGVNNIAATGKIFTDHTFYSKNFNYRIRSTIRLGQNRLEGEGFRKSDDLIRITNKLKYFLYEEKLSAYAEVIFRTQMLRGFEEDNKTVISAFMAPGFLTESVGLSYDPNEAFEFQAGLALRQTFVRIDSLDQLYGFGEDRDVRAEGGLQIIIEVKKELFKNFEYIAEVETFSNLLISLKSTDVIFNNEFRGKINSFMEAVVDFDLIYDDDFSRQVQTRRIIGLGLNFKIL